MVDQPIHYDVFLAHNSADKPAVETIAMRLREAGLHPFLDKWHLTPGMPWQTELEEALTLLPNPGRPILLIVDQFAELFTHGGANLPLGRSGRRFRKSGPTNATSVCEREHRPFSLESYPCSLGGPSTQTSSKSPRDR